MTLSVLKIHIDSDPELITSLTPSSGKAGRTDINSNIIISGLCLETLTGSERQVTRKLDRLTSQLEVK